MYARFATGLPGFVRNPMTLEQARASIQRNLARREQGFLRLIELGVIGNPRSPYARLLRLARCEMGDLRAMTERDGLEKTLFRLREAGVYVTFDEMKGREPIVRGGESFEVESSDFDNPYVAACFENSSGGSTGAGTRVGNDLEHLTANSAHHMLLFHAHGSLHLPLGVWRGTLPDGSGLNNVLRSARHGRIAKRWFTPVAKDAPKPPLRFRIAGALAVGIPRMIGVPLPWPENLTHENAVVVAQWMREMIDAHGGCQMNAPVSRALRVSVAAQENGIDLNGGVFLIAGEPPSEAKVKGIRASGARIIVNYGFAEAGRVAIGCAKPSCDTDMHVMEDAFEVYSRPRPVPGTDMMTDALNITTLLASSPKILINAEIDDSGVVATRRCGCALGELGYTKHLSGVYSYRKLTGEGVTLVGGELIDVVERVLPERFGGSLLDYQFVEEEDAQGFTRLSLRVSPKIELGDEKELVDAVMEALRRSSLMADSARNVWQQSGTLRVVRAEPLLNSRGKLLPLFLAKRVTV
jgi:hypothetical protein